MSNNTLLKDEGKRSKALSILGGIFVVAAAFFVTMYALDWYSAPSTSPSGVTSTSTSQGGSAVTKASAISDLPSLPSSGFKWLALVGLNVEGMTVTPVIPGDPVLRLIAIPTNDVHTVVAQVTGLDKGRTYRIAAWIKPVEAANFEIEAVSGASHGIGIFDLATHNAAGSGSAKAGSAPGPTGWQKVWIDLPTSMEQLVFNLYVLKDQPVKFTGDGRLGVILGGLTVEPQG